jgi:hypothetical protein
MAESREGQEMSKVKGATHYPTKVVNKLASGGMVSPEAASRALLGWADQDQTAQKMKDTFQLNKMDNKKYGLPADPNVQNKLDKLAASSKKQATPVGRAALQYAIEDTKQAKEDRR